MNGQLWEPYRTIQKDSPSGILLCLVTYRKKVGY